MWLSTCIACLVETSHCKDLRLFLLCLLDIAIDTAHTRAGWRAPGPGAFFRRPSFVDQGIQLIREHH
jgi:hypothetical protein